MNRTRTRISRALVGLMVLTLVIGGAVYLQSKSKPHKPTEAAAVIAIGNTPPQMQATPPVPPIAAPSPATRPLLTPMSAVSSSMVTETPNASAIAPSTQPMLAAIVAGKTGTTLADKIVADKIVPDKFTTDKAIPASATMPPGTPPGSSTPPLWTPTPAVAPSAPSSDFLNVASAKVAAGDLLGARRMLNDALLSNQLSPTDTEAARKQLASVNDTVIFSNRKFPEDDYGGIHLVQPGQRLSKIADNYDVPWELIAKINGLSDARKMKSGAKLKIVKGPFNIVVHKKAFTMDLYLGSTPGSPGSLFVKSFPVGLGRDDSTPPGTWLVELGHKTKDPVYYSPRGEGVIAANDPKNPLGHRWIGLSGVDGQAVGQQSYGIHGTIDPDSIGKQASMGCIRMHNEDVEQVFDMVTEGKTQVIVKD